MPVTRTLTNAGDPIISADGAPKANAQITFQLVDAKLQPVVLFDAASDGGDLVVGDIVSATTDSSGLFSTSLWPNTRGEAQTFYKVRLPAGVAGGPAKPFYISVADGTDTLTLLAARTAYMAVQPQILSLFDALLANIIQTVDSLQGPLIDTIFLSDTDSAPDMTQDRNLFAPFTIDMRTDPHPVIFTANVTCGIPHSVTPSKMDIAITLVREPGNFIMGVFEGDISNVVNNREDDILAKAFFQVVDATPPAEICTYTLKASAIKFEGDIDLTNCRYIASSLTVLGLRNRH